MAPARRIDRRGVGEGATHGGRRRRGTRPYACRPGGAEDAGSRTRGRIERGSLTLLSGDPGAGKGMIGVAAVAGLSTGSPLPQGDPERRRCAWIRGPGEDSTSEIRGRLEAAGANLDSIALFAAADAVDPNDPVSVRSWTSRLRTAAGDMTVLAIGHDNKNEGAAAQHRLSGSHQFSAAARGVLTVRDGELSVSKLNDGEKGEALAFSIVGTENGRGAVAWEGPSRGGGGGGGGGGKVREVVDLIEGADEPMTKNQICKALGAKSRPACRKVSVAVDHAATEGLLTSETVTRRGQEYDGYRTRGNARQRAAAEGAARPGTSGTPAPPSTTGVPGVRTVPVDEGLPLGEGVPDVSRNSSQPGKQHDGVGPMSDDNRRHQAAENVAEFNPRGAFADPAPGPAWSKPTAVEVHDPAALADAQRETIALVGERLPAVPDDALRRTVERLLERDADAVEHRVKLVGLDLALDLSGWDRAALLAALTASPSDYAHFEACVDRPHAR